uniref:Phosphoinositide-3-kinase interacting protein 1 n=1 Tax=Oncorhynchus kisutch TaxID=8019 RepID=A0A8C7LGH1_ONCKI
MLNLTLTPSPNLNCNPELKPKIAFSFSGPATCPHLSECSLFYYPCEDLVDVSFSLCSVGVGDHNYCRNPDSSEKPWCYVTGLDAQAQRQSCAIDTCKDKAPTEAGPHTTAQNEVFELTKSGSAQGGGAAVQPVIGISQRIRTGPKKKDLGTLGYVVGILMMAIIILMGVGITFGYFYKRGRDLKKQHEQRVYEREMQRITLPLSAFSNPTCELVDENSIVIMAQEQTPTQEGMEGGDPLMGQQAGTPGA